jgi:cytoskeletal protein RodZ
MPEIGATLREARMRARIDISEIEAETKIRAKYLRALENEEWDLLPGTTYVKTFLRTYADALGLDSKLLVEEYRLRHERLSGEELLPISPRTAQRARAKRPGPPRFGRGWAVGAVVVALLALLYLLGRDNSNDTSPVVTTTPTTQKKASSKSSKQRQREAAARKRRREQAAAARRPVRLQLIPQGAVNVCLIDARGRRLLNSVTLQPGTPTKTYRSKQFRMTLGNGAIVLRVNGKARDVPEVAAGIGYSVTRKGRRVLSPADRPTCQ